jgi:hypothetical protein
MVIQTKGNKTCAEKVEMESDGESKSHTSGRTTVKTTRKPSKNAFFPAKQEKNTRKRT